METGDSSSADCDPVRWASTWRTVAKNRLFGGRAQLEASVFYVNWENIQQQIRLPTCSYSLVTNTGAATRKGFDLNLNVEPINGLLLGAVIGYNDAEYDSSIIVGVRPLVFKGQTLGQTPWTANLSAEYHFDAAGQEAFARAQYIYRGRNDGPFNYQNPAFSQYDPTVYPSETQRRLDLRTGITLGDVDVALFVENALDATPVLDFTPEYIGAPLQTARTLQPRTWGAMATMRF